MSDLIERQAAIEALEHMLAEPAYQHTGEDWYSGVNCAESELYYLPSAQPETYKEKLNEIASALSEKFAYMNTCLNERDIILGYLGVKRHCEIHCNTDCTNTKCESHPLSSAQSERKKGKWRHYESYLTCSECGAEYDDDIMTHCGDDVPKFCPNCGADMRGERTVLGYWEKENG